MRKCSKPFHHAHWLFNIWHISSCELFCEYEVKCMHCGVWRKFLHFTLKNKFHKKNEMESFQGDKLWDPPFFFLASRNHFFFYSWDFSWSAYTSFCGLGQIMCQMFEKFCCHTSFIAINSSFQSWRSWEQSYLFTNSYPGSSGSVLALTTTIFFHIFTGT